MLKKLSVLALASFMLAACSHNGIYRSQLSEECSYQKEGDCADTVSYTHLRAHET